jgi:hypothetical protein
LIDELRDAYKGLKPAERTAYNLERKLQEISDKDVDRIREGAKNCDNPRSKMEKRRCREPYLGWFAKLAENNYSKTCWDSKNQRFREDLKCKDYIYPKSHRVRVWISEPQLLGGRVPQWFMDNGPPRNLGNCDARHQKVVCVEFDVDYNQNTPKEVSVKFSDGSFTVDSIKVPVKDKLIVGLGDSYASGEGNPDIPARFTEGRGERDFFFNFIIKGIPDAFKDKKAPRQDEGSEAAWLDRRCHRSMYSYQFKTALQVALDKPREAVTYVTFSCSGAGTNHIIKDDKKPIEGRGDVRPQLKALNKVLYDKTNEQREIDYLLLSTGGNDLGFSRFVAYVVFSGLPLKGLESLPSGAVNERELRKSLSEKEFEKKLLTDTGEDKNKIGSYPRLQNAILHGEYRIRIKDCNGPTQQKCRRILLTPYPDILKDEKSELCKADRGEFDITFGKDKERAKRIKMVSDNVFDQIQGVQRNSKITDDLGWTVVESNISGYTGHGFCAQNNLSESKTGEKFEMPIREDNRRTLQKDDRWTSFLPWNYKSYEARQRWARLPVDSKLTTDQMRVIVEKIRWGLLKKLRFEWLLEDDRSNIMHPTAEGLARTADANFIEIQKIEKTSSPGR